MKNLLICGLSAAMLAGCGGGSSKPRQSAALGAVPTASGPISTACLGSGRSARSRQLCGCIQAVANSTLTVSEQNRAAAFYNDPHRAQEVRQSDRFADERFWETYNVYVQRAERICR